MSIDKIKETIAQMLAVAENEASTQGEVRNALAMAARLMRKHNLSRDDIQARDDGTFDVSKVGMARQSITLVGVKRTLWEMELARFMCRFIGTIKYYSESYSTRKEPSGAPVDGRALGTVVVFYGPAEDVVLACNLFRDMGLRISHNAKKKMGGYARGNGAVYCQGFVQGLREANARVEREQLEASTGGERGLILANQQVNRQLVQRAENWLSTDQGIKLRSGSGLGGGRGSSAAHSLGVRDGRATKVSRSRPSRLN